MTSLYAQQGTAQQGGGLLMFMPFILIIVIFYFLLVLPQRQQQKKHRQMLTNLKKGDKIVTSGGIHGAIIKIGDDTVTIQSCPKAELVIDKSVITRTLKQ